MMQLEKGRSFLRWMRNHQEDGERRWEQVQQSDFIGARILAIFSERKWDKALENELAQQFGFPKSAVKEWLAVGLMALGAKGSAIDQKRLATAVKIFRLEAGLPVKI